MRKKLFLGIAALMLVALSSCIANKDYIYLQGASKDQVLVPNKVDYRIQKNDILSVSIRTPDALASALFNSGSGIGSSTSGGGGGYSSGGSYGGGGYGGGGAGGNSFYFSGYSIDEDGYIKLPIMGKLKVVGLTIKQIKALIEKEADKYFTGYFINVQLAGINYSIMGEVRISGSISVYKNQHNLLEALAMAGDLTPFANRKHIQIIRQYPDGIRIHEVDITQVSVINSPYFLIQPNDIIYVQPIKRRESGFAIDGLTSFGQGAAIFTTLVSVITAYAIIKQAYK